jgi:hypothetical protein
MSWEVVVVVVAVVLAIPLGVGFCIALGWLVTVYERRTTRCPRCQARQMELVNFIKADPNPHDTGAYYRCLACGGRWFQSIVDRNWQDVSGPEHDRYYRGHGC